MGKRKVVVKQSAAGSIAQIAWFIESKGMVATAERFSDSAYDYFQQMADEPRTFAVCRDPIRAALGYKCTHYKKRYTIVFIESNAELTICEFISSKLIKW